MPGPAIILIDPQLGENIGMAARAMLNCGLTDLRLVNPRDGWPNEAAVAASSGADDLIHNARLFATAEDAVADLSYVIATSARPRDMIKKALTPESAADELHARNGQPSGFMFGPERTGLNNDHIALADAVCEVPLNPDFKSLNLSQAVLLTGYAWYRKTADAPDRELRTGDTLPATKEQLNHMLKHLEDELDATGFFGNADKKPSVLRNIKNCFGRMDLTEQEISTFHGIIAALSGRKVWK